ncbi:hypothetical protein [uncultured Deinococcus sp.]|uniref:hypothetical protein n=1 Tax=uncultured Deinococcus sp. TaxID=158789 RepID=UPI0025D0D8DC|nr:hypothetical protein [uncultured Deinococcus sp.]
MAFEPPAVRPTYIRDYRVPAVATEADIPAFLDWLRIQPEYKGGRVVGVLLQTRDTGALYRVTSQPALGTPGTLADYGLDRTPSGASMQAAVDVLLDEAEGFADLTALVEPALEEVTAAASEALGAAGVNPAHIYDSTQTPGAAPDGTVGAQFTVSGLFQRLKRTAGAWVTQGSSLMTLLGMRLRGGVSVLDYAGLVVNGDWIPAINAALLDGDVLLPPQELLVKPSATNFIQFPPGVKRTLRGSGPTSTLKVADGTGTYSALISQADVSQVLTNVTLKNFRIDQNADNVTGAVISADVATAQNAIRFGAFQGVTIRGMQFDLATGINTVYLGFPGSTDATVASNGFNWGRNGTQADYDNSAIYLNCTGQQIVNNVLRARSIADRARGAIETHGSISVVTGNVAVNFREGINIVTVSPSVTDPATASLTVTDNVLDGGSIGVRLWSITGKVLRNVRASGNTITLNPAQWPEFRDTGGVMMAYSIGGALDGDVDGLRIEDNDITYPATDTRTDYAYSSCAGIGLNGNGNYKNVAINHNRIKNAPMWALVLGRAGKTLAGLQAYNNEIINPGTATGQSPSASRVAVSLSGLITNAVIGNLRVSETTATAQAFGFMTTGLTAGSGVEFQAVRTDAPNNPALAFPTTLPAGVTHKRLIDFTVANIFTAKQSFLVTGARAVEAVSDTVAVYARNTGTQPAIIGDGGAGYGGQFFARDVSALVVQQQGALTGTLGSAGVVALVQRQSAAGAYNITATTFAVDDAATNSTGTRFNSTVAVRWDGVDKLLVSGGSHAMGAGVITLGGWGRASVTLTPPAIADNAMWESPAIAVTGVNANDSVSVGPPMNATGLVATGYVSAFGQVKVQITNKSGAAVTPAAATWAVSVFRK